MTPGLIGKKIGMTRVFTDAGLSRAVTVVEATPNRITQVKTAAVDGYDALQVTVGARRASRVTKAMQGHFAKAGVEPGRRVREFRVEAEALAAVAESGEDSAGESTEESAADSAPAAPKFAVGADLSVTMFSEGQKVDVTGRTIGKGFAGVIKRHGFRGGRATHGNSKAHRLAGATGNAQDPGRIFKGKKMAGQMGGRRRVQQGLEVVRVDAERNLLLIGGAVPGPKGADVIVRPSVKAAAKNSGAQS